MASRKMFEKPKKRRVSFIDFVAIGEGKEKGRTFNISSWLERRKKPARIIMADLEKPGYQFPKHTVFFQRDAVRFLGGIRPSSVKRITDTFAIQYIRLGEGINTPEKAEQLLETPNLAKNMANYIGLVKRTLVPGGKFILVLSTLRLHIFTDALQEAGFKVKTIRLSHRGVLRSKSTQAKKDFGHGEPVYRIIAIKQF